jgi:hypothetical protein
MLMRTGLALILTLACTAVQAASIEMLKSLLQQTNSGKGAVCANRRRQEFEGIAEGDRHDAVRAAGKVPLGI